MLSVGQEIKVFFTKLCIILIPGYIVFITAVVDDEDVAALSAADVDNSGLTTDDARQYCTSDVLVSYLTTFCYRTSYAIYIVSQKTSTFGLL